MKTRPPHSRFICVQSSVTPEGYDRMTFNDLACVHAGRSKTSLFRRLLAAARETINEI